MVQPEARTGRSERSSLWQQGSKDGGFALTRASLAHSGALRFRFQVSPWAHSSHSAFGVLLPADAA